MPPSREPDRVIYGISCRCHPDQGIRYVGLTSRGLTYRMRQHERDARRGDASRLHTWMREHDAIAAVLEVVPDRSMLRVQEIRWMARLRSQGQELLNGTDFWIIENGVWQRSA